MLYICFFQPLKIFELLDEENNKSLLFSGEEQQINSHPKSVVALALALAYKLNLIYTKIFMGSFTISFRKLWYSFASWTWPVRCLPVPDQFRLNGSNRCIYKKQFNPNKLVGIY